MTEPERDLISELSRSMGLLTPNALPTKYAGITFRSRLEARWAVFFDTLGIEWEYEPQGYKIGNGIPEGEPICTYSDGSVGFTGWEKEYKKSIGIEVVSERISEGEGYEWYLPDFWLPDLNVWAEVKGNASISVFQTITKAIDAFSHHTLPNLVNYNEGRLKDIGGLLVLGDIPRSDRFSRAGSHILFGQRKGASSYASRFRVDHGLNEVRLEVAKLCIDTYDVYSMSGERDDQHFMGTETYELNYLIKGLPRDPTYRNYKGETKRYMSLENSINGERFFPIEEDTKGEAAIMIAYDRARNEKF